MSKQHKRIQNLRGNKARRESKSKIDKITISRDIKRGNIARDSYRSGKMK